MHTDRRMQFAHGATMTRCADDVSRRWLTQPCLLASCREQIGAPGMVVLQFAWGGGTNNVHLPHMHYENSFCYPGTHDNETAVGWFAGSANAQVG